MNDPSSVIPPLPGSRILSGEVMATPACGPFAGGQVCWFSTVSPAKDHNEDCAALFSLGPDHGVLAVADGVGGMPDGNLASRTALDSLHQQLQAAQRAGTSIGAALLDGFEAAGEAVAARHRGAATTLAVVEIRDRHARTFHTGDSEIVICDAEGALLWRTLPHSPVGYAVEAGVLNPHEAMFHDARHLVSNVVGNLPTSMDVSTHVPLPPGASILLASDGLVDNLHLEEIVPRLAAEDLGDGVADLVATALRRMHQTEPGPCKPDDLTILAWRRPA